MMTAIQAWMLTGALLMGGVVALVWWLIPVQPDAAAVAALLSPTRTQHGAVAEGEGLSTTERLGFWAVPRLPSALRAAPEKDLAILAKPTHAFFGEKLLLAAVGLVAGPLVSGLFVYAFQLPLVIPVAASVAAAVGLWFVPNGEVAKRARDARLEFTRAVGTYVDLIALERRAGGSGPRQAMENAAKVGSSWPFRRMADVLARSRFAGTAPWDALRDLADEIGVPDLADVADIMRMAGEEGTQVYETLRASSTALRHSMLSAEHVRANEVAQRMLFPSTATGLIFSAIVIAPSIMRLLAG